MFNLDKMIETPLTVKIGILIWNIGGILFTILLIGAVLTFLISYIINRLVGWTDKENRENIFYYLKNKKRIDKIVEEEKSQITKEKKT